MASSDLDELFDALDLTVREYGVSVTLVEGLTRTLDYRLEREADGQQFLCDPAYASNVKNFFTTTLYRKISLLRSATSIAPYRDARGLIVLKTDQFTAQQDQRFRTLMRAYAPDMEHAVVVLDSGWVSSLGESSFTPRKDSTQASSDRGPRLRFSEKELLLTKRLFYEHPDSPVWTALGEGGKNPHQLSKQADVSVGKAGQWAKAMREEGFLTSKDAEEMQLRDLHRLQDAWMNNYRIQDNEKLGEYVVEAEGDSPLERVLFWIRSLPEQNREQLIITGEAAQAIHGGTEMNGEAIDLFYLGSSSNPIDHLGGLEAAKGESDVRFWSPKFPEAVKKPSMKKKEVILADPFQQILDS